MAEVGRTETGEVRGWAHEDGERVISAKRMEIARREGGASVMAVAGYKTPLYTAPGAQPIEKAPREVMMEDGIHRHGRKVLVFAAGEWVRAGWWETTDGKASNFIADGGRAVYPSHWQELPPKPTRSDKGG